MSKAYSYDDLQSHTLGDDGVDRNCRKLEIVLLSETLHVTKAFGIQLLIPPQLPEYI